MSNLATIPPQGSPAQPRQQMDFSPQTFDQALTFCDYLADSDLVPKDFKGKPANCLIAMQWGAELGLKPLQAVQNIAIINGRPALWGDAVIALVRSSPLCEYITESDDGKAATCRVKRRGEPEEVRIFSMDDAKAAGLAGKQGPWTQYPKRMRQMRARAFALRDVFPDVLKGMPIAEEIMDIQPAGEQRAVAAVVSQPAAYPAEDFARNLPSWRGVIESGRKTADQIVAMVSSKGQLSAEQIDAIRAPFEPAPAESSENPDFPLSSDNQEPQA
ncbi:recombinase RecT [Pseudoxanthomonas dokdonensis]|uniref:recombinase RecT n=1 Tax=Pseudoxanthomonas dokdonensis TaxID=344882 RepID=UPI000A811A35|nr:recombinase RecT [Pseudoxanthomonas dokdonensis]